MTQPSIELKDLSKSYGQIQALAGVDLLIEPGEVFGFLGPNGAGKTTTIRILFDLIRPSGGQAFVLGFDCQRQGPAARRHMAYLPGELSLYDSLTGAQTIEYFSSLRPLAPDPTYLRQLPDRSLHLPGLRVLLLLAAFSSLYLAAQASMVQVGVLAGVLAWAWSCSSGTRGAGQGQSYSQRRRSEVRAGCEERGD